MMFRPRPFRLLMAVAFVLPLALTACGPQAPAPAKPAAEPTKPAAAAPAAPAGQPGASPAAAQPAAPAAQPTAAAATAKAPADKKNLNVVTSADISKLDPHMSTSVNDITVSFQIFDNLTTRDPDLKLIPQLATEWKTLNDTTWEFKLRPGVKFHNGDPLTSADVKFSVERTYDPEAKTRVALVFGTVDRIET